MEQENTIKQVEEVKIQQNKESADVRAQNSDLKNQVKQLSAAYNTYK